MFLNPSPLKNSNPPPVPPPRRYSANTFTATVQVHITLMTTRSATRSAAKTVSPALPSQASANMAMQNYVTQKTKSAQKSVGELCAKAKNVTTRLTTPKTNSKKGKKK